MTAVWTPARQHSPPALTTAPQSFDVASIKVSQIGKAGGEGSRREHPDLARSVNMRNVSLKTAIRWPGIGDYQVSGPNGWPMNATTSWPKLPDRRPTRNSDHDRPFADRFKLAVHHQTKEMSAYALVVGKNDPKFQESHAGREPVVPDRRP